MLQKLLTKLKHETRFVLRISIRDMSKRLAMSSLLLGVCFYGGTRVGLVVIAALLILSEVWAWAIARHVGYDTRQSAASVASVSAISARTAFWVWFINVGSTAVYLWPAVFLAQMNSIPMLLAGFLWIFGSLVHVSNTFIALPIYNRSQMVPATAVALGIFWLASKHSYENGTGMEWLIASGLMLIYIAHTFETFLNQNDTQVALDNARAEASARLIALERMTRQDPLTGLLNRRAFDEHLDQWLSEPSDQGNVAVIVIDLNGFKPVNDTYSHAAGDAVLLALAQRLTNRAGKAGVVGRLGGDEFVLALRAASSPAAAVAFAEVLLRDIHQPISYGDRKLSITASIGVAMATAQDSAATLLSGADKAMYRGKLDEVSRVVLFDPAVHLPRASLEDRRVLLAAMLNNEIRPYYQPKVDIRSGRIIGFEALARWEHPVLGLLSPGEFIPQINELGLQGDFQIHMANSVIGDVAKLVEESLDPGQVSLNISEAALATLSGRQELTEVIVNHPHALPHLTLEITEDVFIARAGSIMQASISHFRGLGLRMSLDDFGTGFASFQHLRQFEFDEMKIDRSFVADLLEDNGTSEVLITGFMAIAQGLNITVVAEGIETDAQARKLVAMGCTCGQGFFYGQSVPYAEVHRNLRAAHDRKFQLPREVTGG